MEIERKYLLSEDDFKKLGIPLGEFALETRFYLYCKDDNEIRITRRDIKPEASFTLDRMELLQDETQEFTVRRKERIIISKDEFETIVSKLPNQEPVLRLHYKLNDQIEIKVYQGRHEGLIRAEVEFESVEISTSYKPSFSFRSEITNTKLGRDVRLAQLSDEEFLTALSSIDKH